MLGRAGGGGRGRCRQKGPAAPCQEGRPSPSESWPGRSPRGGSRVTATHGRALGKGWPPVPVRGGDRPCPPWGPRLGSVSELSQRRATRLPSACGGVRGTPLRSKDVELPMWPQALTRVELKRLNYQILKCGLILNEKNSDPP